MNKLPWILLFVFIAGTFLWLSSDENYLKSRRFFNGWTNSEQRQRAYYNGYEFARFNDTLYCIKDFMTLIPNKSVQERDVNFWGMIDSKLLFIADNYDYCIDLPEVNGSGMTHDQAIRIIKKILEYRKSVGVKEDSYMEEKINILSKKVNLD